MNFSGTLPIDAHILDIVRALEEKSSVILEAPPGSGKTTRVPPALWEHRKALGIETKKVLVLEPRRSSTKAAASRVAEERRWRLGAEVGYRIRGESAESASTLLVFATEAILLKMFAQDATLLDVGAIVFDEFHERHPSSDIGLALALHLQRELRPELKIVVMSATLKGISFEKAMPKAAYVSVHVPTHPLEVLHSELGGNDLNLDILPGRVVQALNKHLQPKDSALVFVPGRAEISRVIEELSKSSWSKSHELLALHGSLSVDAQLQLIQNPEQRRRIVVSTNIAESSVTVAGVRLVVDSGLAKVQRCHGETTFEKLQLERISKAQADQRAGRAAREAPGTALRLWSLATHDQLSPQLEPELHRVSWVEGLWELSQIGMLNELDALPWVDEPRKTSLDLAFSAWQALGLINRDRSWTKLGKTLSSLQTSLDLRELLFCALTPQREKSLCIQILVHLRDTRSLSSLPNSTMGDAWDTLLQQVQQHSRGDSAILRKIEAEVITVGAACKNFEADGIRQAWILTHLDRLAKRRKDSVDKWVSHAGVGLRSKSTGVAGDWIVVHEVSERVQQGTSELWVQRWTEVHEKDLDFGTLKSRAAVERQHQWNADRTQVQCVERLRFGGIDLSDPHGAPVDALAALQMLCSEWWQKHRVSNDVWLQFLGRLEFCKQLPAAKELHWPEVSADWLCQLAQNLELVSATMDSFEKWLGQDNLLQGMPRGIQQFMQQHAPETLRLKNGIEKRVDYRDSGQAKVSGRVQDFFGLQHHPQIGLSKHPALIEMLSPAQRPVSRTSNLEAFWSSSYPNIRKELRGRYPKHPWPDDPTAASPRPPTPPRPPRK